MSNNTFIANCAKTSKNNEEFINRMPSYVIEQMVKVKFPQNWKVEKIPAGRAVVRFMVNDRFSVFFDAVGEMADPLRGNFTTGLKKTCGVSRWGKNTKW